MAFADLDRRDRGREGGVVLGRRRVPADDRQKQVPAHHAVLLAVDDALGAREPSATAPGLAHREQTKSGPERPARGTQPVSRVARPVVQALADLQEVLVVAREPGRQTQELEIFEVEGRHAIGAQESVAGVGPRALRIRGAPSLDLGASTRGAGLPGRSDRGFWASPAREHLSIASGAISSRPMNLALYSDPHVSITIDAAAGLVRYVRSHEPYPTLDVLRDLHRKIRDELSRLPPGELRLLIDVREAPARNDDPFEAEITRALRAIMPRFAARAVLVKSAVGLLQANRLARARGDGELAVFGDEAEALEYLNS